MLRDAYLDEFCFRHNRRKTAGVDLIAARVIEYLIAKLPRTMRHIIDPTIRCRRFTTPPPELTA